MTELIQIDAAILGGTPCFYGSRTPVVVLFYYLANGHTLSEIFDAYPAMPRDSVVDALRKGEFPLTAMRGHVDDEELALWKILADEACSGLSRGV